MKKATRFIMLDFKIVLIIFMSTLAQLSYSSLLAEITITSPTPGQSITFGTNLLVGYSSSHQYLPGATLQMYKGDNLVKTISDFYQNPDNTVSVSTSGLLPGSDYRIRIYAAYMPSYGDAWSEYFTIKELSSPIMLATSSISSSGFVVNWEPVEGATGYRIDISTKSDFSTFLYYYNNHNTSALTGSETSKAVNISISPGTTYYYRLRAINGSFSSLNSSIIEVRTLYPGEPPAPFVLATSSISSSGFVVNWEPVEGTTGYRIDISTKSDFSTFLYYYNNHNTSALTGSETSKVVNTSISPETTYYYRLRAVNENFTSQNSQTIKVTTLAIPPPKPDLEPINLIAPSSSDAGSLITVGATIKNRGSADSNPTTIKYYLSSDQELSSEDTYLGYQSIPSLTAGTSSIPFLLEVTIPSSINSGIKYILYQVDPDDIIDEYYKNNNIGSKQITITKITTVTTTTIDFNKSDCNFSSTCNYFYDNPINCSGHNFKVSHGSPQYISPLGIKSILLNTDNSSGKGEGFFLNYSFKAGNSYSIKVYAYTAYNYYIGGIIVSAANGLVQRNDECNLGLKPSNIDEIKIEESWVNIDYEPYGSSDVVFNKDYDFLWIYSKAYNGFDGISVEKIVITETSSTGSGGAMANNSSHSFPMVNSYVKVLKEENTPFIYPNPTNSLINITNINYEEYRLILTDLTGNTIFHKDFNEKFDNKIDLSSQPSGLYLLTIINNNQVRVKKVKKD